MVVGELYFGGDPELTASRMAAQRLLRQLITSAPEDPAERERIVRSLFGRVGRAPVIVPPFACDYGWNISVGDDFYANFNCTILDVAPVTIGDHVLLAPNVQIYTATHPIDPAERRSDLEFGRPITIGHNVWIGGGAILCPGVTIGDDTVIGAGSVVTKSLPGGVVAAGNPARILRNVR